MPRPKHRAHLGIESLERREVPANLSVTSIALVDNGGGNLSSIAVGERLNVAVTYNWTGPGSHSAFFADVTLNGVSKSVIIPAGSASTGMFRVDDFVPPLGSNHFKVNLDPTNFVPESTNADNIKSMFVTPKTFKSAYTGETKFTTPLAGTPSVHWRIGNYLDLDLTEGELADYKGKLGDDAWTYDNHNGMDIGPSGLGWDTQHNGLPIIAAAGGVVIYSHDGEFDEQTSKGKHEPGPGGGNGVEIDHGNGWVTEYYHFRNGSVAVKEGDYVNAGDMIGLMGSSGNSTGTHLHFDVRHNGRLVEPYVAPNTYWKNPQPYQPDVDYSLQTYTNHHITENGSYAKFKVHRGPFDSDTWNFKTVNGSATTGSDYEYTSGTVHFGFGDHDEWVYVPILNDSIREGNEYFSIEAEPDGSGTAYTQYWTIIDDDRLLNLHPNSGVLTIDAATDQLDDVVRLEVKGSNLEITANNVIELFPLAKVKEIKVETGAGYDHITIVNRPEGVPMMINAGDGDDVINLNGTQPGKGVVLNGGDGDDTFNVGKPKPNYGTMSLNGFLGDMTANGGDGDNVLNIGGNAFAESTRSYTIGWDAVSWGVAQVMYSKIGTINLSAGSGGDSITITSDNPGQKINVDAGEGNDKLTGPSAMGNLWNITAKNAGNINFNAITFTGVENLTGGSKDDGFKFKSGASLTGNLKGGGGFDGLSYAGLAGPVNLDLQTSKASLIGGTFSELETFNGSNSAADTLYGPNGANAWHIGGANGLTLNGATTVWNFEKVTGGNGDDTFTFTENGSLGGKVDGAGGFDTLDYSKRQSGVFVDLAAKTATATGGINSFESVIGSQGDDTLAGNGVGAGISLWNVTGHNVGSFAGPSTNLFFVGVENLKGYSNTDWFIFGHGGKVDGKVDGQGGSDWLNMSAYLTGVTVDVGAQTATTAGKIANLEYFVGGNSFDTFVGPNATNDWKLSGKNAGKLNNLFNFNGFESLAGGAMSDVFVFGNGVTLDGPISGGDDLNNTLDYSAYTNAITVNLAEGQATGVAAGVQGINHVYGGTGNDTITGNGLTNFLKGNGGNDQLEGGDGADLLLGGVGNDNVVGNAGRDLMIGGAGQDVMYGLDGDDILVGGSTQHDGKSDALLALLNLWNQREGDYETRVDLLRNIGVMGGLFKLNAPSMINDGVKDTLHGLTDSDWFWILGPDVTDNAVGEFLN